MNRREHQPDVDAAAYVSGVMRPRARRRFERHILTCETCWHEVRLDRRGRHLAELGRESAPADLREGVRAAVAAGTGSSDDFADAQIENMSSFPGRRRMGLSAVAAALVVLIVAGAFAWHGRSGEPAPITAALDTYRTSAVSESDHHMMPPDLTNLGLEPMGAETMALADMPVEAFAYRGQRRKPAHAVHGPHAVSSCRRSRFGRCRFLESQP